MIYGHMIYRTRLWTNLTRAMSVRKAIFVFKGTNVLVALVHIHISPRMNVSLVMGILKILCLAFKVIHQLSMGNFVQFLNMLRKANVKYVPLVLDAKKTIKMAVSRSMNVLTMNTLRMVILIATTVRLALVFCV